MSAMTVAQLVKKQTRTIRIVDSNTEIHHLYYEVRFSGHTIWSCGSDDPAALNAEAQLQAKRIVQKLHRQAGLPVPTLNEVKDFKVELV